MFLKFKLKSVKKFKFKYVLLFDSFILIFNLSNNMLVKNFILKLDKWDDPNLYIYRLCLVKLSYKLADS
jgi:hypothetical protein